MKILKFYIFYKFIWLFNECRNQIAIEIMSIMFEIKTMKNVTSFRMLSQVFSRFAHQVQLPRAVIDLRNYIRVGDKAEISKTISTLATVNRTGLPGDEALSTARMMEQIEIVTANMIEKNLDKDHQSAGYYISVHHIKPAFLGQEIRIQAEVTSVEDNKASFRTLILDGKSGDIIGSGVHSRIITRVE
ncbi:hypothetical protein TRFO_02915 [Tritrichomonas foetus]|uniref:Fluoroacetyl-CoA-specific thioesterase-like domain-containing protein n=1 Tax=Tritrichomonas foetus TaxID=1144522 RepID=A0A1J4L0R5_9EUKA|nr:hypothetical protein TRFO_02915 [Tritrichomonas foetus]|eukprot:OHT15566.1 hypothetical protein TRFO_02915 [Tritrichomonas foetus]